MNDMDRNRNRNGNMNGNINRNIHNMHIDNTENAITLNNGIMSQN